MKRRIALLLCFCFLFFAACGNRPESASPAEPLPPSPPSAAPAEPSQPAESPAAGEADGDKEASPPASEPQSGSAPASRLAVPIQIVRESDDPKAYETGEQQRLLGGEKEIQQFRQWMETLEVGEVTAVYGVAMPVDEYSRGEMSLGDSQTVFEKLKGVTPHLYPMSEEEGRNPWTGGGWDLAVHTPDRTAVFSFNGGWFIVRLQGEENFWIFNVDKTPGQDLCYEISQLLYDNMNNSPDPVLYYQGSVLQHLYAVDANSYVMAEVVGNTVTKEILGSFEGRKADDTNRNGYGFLIINGDGKQYQYLNDDEADAALNKYCLAALTNGKLHPSWLIHMTPDRLIGANGVTDREKLNKLSDFLKQEVTVEAETTTHPGPENPDMVMGLFQIRMEFDSGVEYTIIGYDYFDGTGNFSLYASDLETTVSYRLDAGVAEKITAFLGSFS